MNMNPNRMRSSSALLSFFLLTAPFAGADSRSAGHSTAAGDSGQAGASGAFYTPEQDREGLTATSRCGKGLPTVLLIGDSISIGYTKPVIQKLEGVAHVQRVKVNCGSTKTSLKPLKRWLGDMEWDVIHFNWGLHDLCYRHPDSKVYGNRDKVNGTIAVPLEQYAKNLDLLVGQMKKTGAKLVWASTTVVPEGEAGRKVGDEIKYNAVAEGIMKKHGVTINDLHALTASMPAKRFTAPGDVHFTKEGYAQLADQVVAAIRRELNQP